MRDCPALLYHRVACVAYQPVQGVLCVLLDAKADKVALAHPRLGLHLVLHV